jgi:hypothetical protein
MSFAAVAQVPTLNVGMPEQLSLSTTSVSKMVTYRGVDGELWLLLVIQGDGTEGVQDKTHSQFRSLAESYANGGVPHRFEKASIADSGTLLLFAQQSSKDGKPHGYLEFKSFWPNGLYASGQIEWPGMLDAKVDDYIRRLRLMRIQRR